MGLPQLMLAHMLEADIEQPPTELGPADSADARAYIASMQFSLDQVAAEERHDRHKRARLDQLRLGIATRQQVPARVNPAETPATALAPAKLTPEFRSTPHIATPGDTPALPQRLDSAMDDALAEQSLENQLTAVRLQRKRKIEETAAAAAAAAPTAPTHCPSPRMIQLQREIAEEYRLITSDTTTPPRPPPPYIPLLHISPAHGVVGASAAPSTHPSSAIPMSAAESMALIVATAVDKVMTARATRSTVATTDGLTDPGATEKHRLKNVKSVDVVPKFTSGAQQFGATIAKAAFDWIDPQRDWFMSVYNDSIEQKKTEVLETLATEPHQGENMFVMLVNDQIQRASMDTLATADDQQKQMQQQLVFNQEWIRFRKKAQGMTAHWSESGNAYTMQVELCIREALDMQMPLAEMAMLQKHNKFQSGFENGSSAVPQHTPPLPTTPRKDVAICGGLQKGGPQPSQTPNSFPCPNAASLIGASTGGAINKAKVTCTFRPCPEKKGHHSTECPAAANPGRTMPGFDLQGERKPESWDGNNITDETRIQWAKMQRHSVFVKSQHLDCKTLPEFGELPPCEPSKTGGRFGGRGK
eukprot:3640283-Rhodomonas_salina.3